MKPFLLCACLASGLTLPLTLQADLLEEVDSRLDQGLGEIRLVFAVPVRYLNHFPAERGELLKVYLQALGDDEPGDGVRHGAKRSPGLAWVPAHTVTYTTARSCYAARQPLCLDIQFSQSVQYRIRPGEDGHSLVIHILPRDGKPSPKP
jgi:hypothetical protein